MDLGIGKELSKEKYEELVKGTPLEGVSLDELVDVAINGEGMNEISNGRKFWEYAGSYYRYNNENYLVISIDREQTVGGYNNSELKIVLINNKYITTNNRTFTRLIPTKSAEKEKQIEI